jgi:hypothetical protein
LTEEDPRHGADDSRQLLKMNVSAKVVRRAFEILWNLSAVDYLRAYMLEADAIDKILIAMRAKSGHKGCLYVGAGVLCNLTIDPSVVPDKNSDILVTLVDLVVHPILQLIKSKPYDAHLKAKAIWVIWTLAHETAGITKIMEHGGLDIMLKALNDEISWQDPGGPSSEILANTTGALWNLTDKSDVASLVKELFGLQKLTILLKVHPHIPEVQTHVLGILRNMVPIIESREEISLIVGAATEALKRSLDPPNGVFALRFVYRVLRSMAVTTSNIIRPEDFASCLLEHRTVNAVAASMHLCFNPSILLLDDLLVNSANSSQRQAFLKKKLTVPLMKSLTNCLMQLRVSALSSDVQIAVVQLIQVCTGPPLRSFALSKQFQEFQAPYNIETKIRQ